MFLLSLNPPKRRHFACGFFFFNNSKLKEKKNKKTKTKTKTHLSQIRLILRLRKLRLRLIMIGWWLITWRVVGGQIWWWRWVRQRWWSRGWWWRAWQTRASNGLNRVQWFNEAYKRMVMKKLEYCDGQSPEYYVFRWGWWWIIKWSCYCCPIIIMKKHLRV